MKKISLLTMLFLSTILFASSMITPATLTPTKVSALDDSIPEIGADDVWQDYNITGRNVKVGVIDTGIDWRCPDFWRPNGTEYDWIVSGSDWYVDLDDDGVGDPNEELILFDFSFTPAGYTPEYDWLINDANSDTYWDYGQESVFLSTGLGNTLVLLGECKVQEIWDISTGYYWQNGLNLTYEDSGGTSTEIDSNGHGTNVASIVAGGQIYPIRRNYVGVAPDADLTIVKLYTWSSTEVIDAIHYCVNQGVDIISMSLGFEYWQFWDGSDDLEKAVDWAYNQGVPVVVAAANRANDKQHWYHTVSTGTNIRFFVNTTYIYDWIRFTILWRNASNPITFTLTDPSLATSVAFGVNMAPITNVSNFQLVPGGVGIHSIEYRELVSSRGTVRMDVDITGPGIVTGNWQFNVASSSSSEDLLVVAYDGREYKVTMLDHVTVDYTLTTPATADHAITVASYNTYLPSYPPYTSYYVGNISYFSSRGPRIDDTNKMTIAAPGMFIYASMSIDADYGSGIGYIGWVGYAGTSQATPHVAGTIALMMEGNTTLKGQPQDVHDILTSTARVDSWVSSDGTPPNNVWGYGKLDAESATMTAMGLTPTVGEFSATQFLLLPLVMFLMVGMVFSVSRFRKKNVK